MEKVKVMNKLSVWERDRAGVSKRRKKFEWFLESLFFIVKMKERSKEKKK